MTENAASNLTQILSAYQQFLLCYENPIWAKNADVEDIKSAFKLGLFIEKSVENFKNKGCFDSFFKLLQTWCTEKSLNLHKEQFFALANDRILEKLFRFPKIKESTLDIGVRMYTSMYQKERFKKCIETLIITSSSELAIAEFVNTSLTNPSLIEHRIILRNWSKLILNHKENLKLEIDGYLSLYKVEAKLPTIFSLLGLPESISEAEKSVQNLIYQCLEEKMLDRSILSVNFWTALFQTVDAKCLLVVTANKYPNFLKSLLNFIEYIGSMMKKDNENQWKSDSNVCFCPNISQFDIVKVLEEICSDFSVKNQVLGILHEMKEHSNQEFWTDIIGQICDR